MHRFHEHERLRRLLHVALLLDRLAIQQLIGYRIARLSLLGSGRGACRQSEARGSNALLFNHAVPSAADLLGLYVAI